MLPGLKNTLTNSLSGYQEESDMIKKSDLRDWEQWASRWQLIYIKLVLK